VTALDDFMTRIRADYAGREPARAELEAIGRALHTLCATFPFDATLHRLARAGEALMAELDVDPRGGPSLYLVSDGEGVDTVPHHHQTWAVILGIRGEEFNVFHTPTGDGQGRVVTSGEARVGPGDVLVMPDADDGPVTSVPPTRGSLLLSESSIPERSLVLVLEPFFGDMLPGSREIEAGGPPDAGSDPTAEGQPAVESAVEPAVESADSATGGQTEGTSGAPQMN